MDRRAKFYLTILVLFTLVSLVWIIERLNYPYPEAYQIEWAIYIQQPDDITCGPTSATMVLRQFGKDVDVDTVKAKTRTEWVVWNGTPVGMTSPEMIPKALDHFGVPAFQTQASLEQLKHYVSQNRPCIALVRSGMFTFHYVVVIGYDGVSIILADPGGGERTEISERDFLGAWSFNTDMQGVRMTFRCKICNGRGEYVSGFGPLGKCEVCNGTGEVDDMVKSLLWAAEVYPYTLVVSRIHTE